MSIGSIKGTPVLSHLIKKQSTNAAPKAPYHVSPSPLVLLSQRSRAPSSPGVGCQVEGIGSQSSPLTLLLSLCISQLTDPFPTFLKTLHLAASFRISEKWQRSYTGSHVPTSSSSYQNAVSVCSTYYNDTGLVNP